jgi:hypothetical protein
MLWIVVIGALIALFYFWLMGHWFARVLVCVGMAPFFLVMFSKLCPHDGMGALCFVVTCGTAAWFGSGIPIYAAKRRERYRDANFSLTLPNA